MEIEEDGTVSFLLSYSVLPAIDWHPRRDITLEESYPTNWDFTVAYTFLADNADTVEDRIHYLEEAKLVKEKQ